MTLEHIFTSADKWFKEYTASFLSGDYSRDHGFELKILHTRNVVRRAAELALFLEAENGPDDRRRCGAKLGALLHDAGRFEQFKRYQTFNDSISEDHGKLAIEVIDNHGVLADLEARDRRLGEAVRFAVFVHNKLSIPPEEDRLAVLLAKIVRDADRIDIFRIMAEQLGKPLEPGQEAVFLHFEDTGFVSDEVFASIKNGEIVRRDTLRGKPDFICQILSWINIMNYPYSCRVVNDSGNFTALLACLPRDKRGNSIREILNKEMERKLQATA